MRSFRPATFFQNFVHYNYYVTEVFDYAANNAYKIASYYSLMYWLLPRMREEKTLGSPCFSFQILEVIKYFRVHFVCVCCHSNELMLQSKHNL